MSEAPREDSSAVEGPPGEAPRLWGVRTWLSAALALGLLVVLVLLVDVEAVWKELQKCDLRLAFLGLLAHYATYYVRGARWRRTLKHLHRRVRYAKFALLVFFYNFVDNLVPAKLGDLYGAHLARINLGVRRSAALGSIVFLRMIDAWLVVTLAGVSSWLVFSERLPRSVLWALVFGGVIAIAATLLLVTFALLRKYPLERLPEAVRTRISSFQSGMWPRSRELVLIGVLTLVVWGLEILWMWLLALSFGMHLGPAEMVFLTTIPLLASAFPLTPSGAGVVELSLYGCLRALDAPAALAVSVTVVNRLIDYWLHIGLGIVTWSLRDRLGLRTWMEVPLEAPIEE